MNTKSLGYDKKSQMKQGLASSGKQGISGAEMQTLIKQKEIEKQLMSEQIRLQNSSQASNKVKKQLEDQRAQI